MKHITKVILTEKPVYSVLEGMTLLGLSRQTIYNEMEAVCGPGLGSIREDASQHIADGLPAPGHTSGVPGFAPVAAFARGCHF